MTTERICYFCGKKYTEDTVLASNGCIYYCSKKCCDEKGRDIGLESLEHNCPC